MLAQGWRKPYLCNHLRAILVAHFQVCISAARPRGTT
jgi:hypothetical protein